MHKGFSCNHNIVDRRSSSLFLIGFGPGPLDEANVGQADPLEGARRHALPPEDLDDELGLALAVAVQVVTAKRVPYRLVQGGPSASGKKYVDTKFEVTSSCKFIL